VVADPDTPEVTWLHVHVIPAENLELRTRVEQAAPLLNGITLEETWRGALRAPERYRALTPTDVVPDAMPTEWQEWRVDLAQRYLT
jgi:hypothetical protein